MFEHPINQLTDADIDDAAAERIYQYEQLAGTAVTLPVPVHRICEQVLGLDFDWDEIEEYPGEQILGGLIPRQRRIVLNTAHLDLFEAKPGLERSTIGHEMGHWDIHLDRGSLNHPRLRGFDTSAHIVKRGSSRGDSLLVEVLNRAVHDDRYYKLYQQLKANHDHPDVRNAVDTYQSSLLMPKWLMLEAADDFDLSRWRDLYAFADFADVTISNLVRRLRRLDLIFIPEGTTTLYLGQDDYRGQRYLF